MRRYGLFTLALASLLAASSGSALTLGFDCITGNLAGDCAIGEAQLSVEVTDEGGGEVRFHFRNASGGAISAISEIYFDDGSLLDIAAVLDGPGVDFEEDANPPNLPGGNLVIPPFQVTAGFLAESTPPPSQNGVRPGEWVAIVYTLQGGQTYADVLSELSDGTLRIGLHVIAFGSGGSESFVNVPEPGTLSLVALGLAAGSLAARRRRVH